MIDTKVAKRYAKSLLDFAKEKGEMDSVLNDMKLLASVCDSSRELSALLASPIINMDKKATILKKVFSGKVSNTTMAFFGILTHKGREAHLEGIAKEYIRSYKEYKGIQTAIITSAVGLDDKLRKEVYDTVKKSLNSEIELIEKVDKDLIGGFVVRVGDKQYDASIARDLRHLRQELIDSSYVRKN